MLKGTPQEEKWKRERLFVLSFEFFFMIVSTCFLKASKVVSDPEY